jgi:hypothetical protein
MSIHAPATFSSRRVGHCGTSGSPSLRHWRTCERWENAGVLVAAKLNDGMQEPAAFCFARSVLLFSLVCLRLLGYITAFIIVYYLTDIVVYQTMFFIYLWMY